MLIECRDCQVRPAACGDCVVTALLGTGGRGAVDVSTDELHALDVLAEVGMVPPLRLVTQEQAKRRAS